LLPDLPPPVADTHIHAPSHPRHTLLNLTVTTSSICLKDGALMRHFGKSAKLERCKMAMNALMLDAIIVACEASETGIWLRGEQSCIVTLMPFRFATDKGG